jgi:adenylate cyclase
MVRISKRRKRFITGVLAAVAVGLVFCVISHFNLLHGIHLKSGDFLYRTADSDTTTGSDKPIVIVAIDDRSLEQLGRFSSWPRSYHSQLVNILAENGARIIAFDILFSEPSPDDDDELAASIKQAGNVILPFVGTMEVPPSAAMSEANGSGKIIKSLESFEKNALAVGHANISPDEDGIVRRLPILLANSEGYDTALALTAIAKYLRRPQIIESTVEDNYLSFAGRSIPLDDTNRMMINYTDNPASSGDIIAVSYVDVLRNDFSPDTFNDKIVLIGVTAIGFGDTFWTPVGRIMSGVEIHARAMRTILSGDFLKPATAPVTYLSILLLAVLCGLAVLRFRVLWATLSTVFLGIIYILAAFYFFDRGIVVDMLYPPLAMAGAFVGVNLYSVTSEQLEKREIARTFGRYVSPSVAKKILNAVDEGSLRLGGEECTVSVLFADVRNFTGFSEKTNPQELVYILNRYLSEIIRVVLQHDGMVNKFGGDSIMAIWNVPVGCPEHALAAARAAVRAQQAVSELPEMEENLPKIEFGMGINTGNVVAGNMGSVDRLEYSVIGDAVNIAARLADTAPGGTVWIGAGTFELTQDYVSARPLAPLSLKGKREKYQAYEVIAILENAINKNI